MSYLRDTEEHTYSPDRVWSGTIATTAQSMSDTVSVVLPGLVGDIRWDDCRWAPKDNITLPQMGDECVVVMDDTGQICVVDWGDMPYVVNGKIPMGQPDGTVDWVDPPTSGGEPGPQGPKGDKGDKGDTGNTGPQGVQGVKGDKGDTGNTGAQGAQGNTGATGPGVPAGGATGTILTKKSAADLDTAWQAPAASGSQITYRGDYSASTTYHDGDYVVGGDGYTYQCVKEGTVGVTPAPWSTGVWAQLPTVVNGQWLKGQAGGMVWSAITPADVSNIPYGTTLPAAPYDGQEAILVDSLTNPAFQWRFRYNAGSTNAYKWEFIGGAPWTARLNDYTVTGVGAWQMAPGSFSVPRTGRYIIQSQANPASTNASVQYYGIALDGSICDPYLSTSLPAGYYALLTCRVFANATAGQNVQGACNSGYQIGTFYGRDLSMVPQRVQ